jgi:hypothetical protein
MESDDSVASLKPVPPRAPQWRRKCQCLMLPKVYQLENSMPQGKGNYQDKYRQKFRQYPIFGKNPC